MSHIVTVKDIQMTNKVALEAALSRLEEAGRIQRLGHGRHELYSRHVEGEGIKLLAGKTADGEEHPGWTFPVVITDTGEVKYDNYGGSWGDQLSLDEVVQMYGVEAAKHTAMMQGMVVEEGVDSVTGDILLTCTG